MFHFLIQKLPGVQNCQNAEFLFDNLTKKACAILDLDETAMPSAHAASGK